MLLFQLVDSASYFKKNPGTALAFEYYPLYIIPAAEKSLS